MANRAYHPKSRFIVLLGGALGVSLQCRGARRSPAGQLPVAPGNPGRLPRSLGQSRDVLDLPTSDVALIEGYGQVAYCSV